LSYIQYLGIATALAKDARSNMPFETILKAEKKKKIKAETNNNKTCYMLMLFICTLAKPQISCILLQKPKIPWVTANPPK
jgi:hypothetical protein